MPFTHPIILAFRRRASVALADRKCDTRPGLNKRRVLIQWKTMAHPSGRRRLPPLGALRAFEAAARHGSFKNAAQELLVTPTAVSHQIRSLEERLGLALFARRVRKVTLTDAGASLYPVLRDGFDSFQAVLDHLVRARTRPRVTLSATSAFTAKWLVPRMADFQRRHPGIELHLHASNEAVDLVTSGIDIAIRYGPGPYPDLVSEPLFADQFAPIVNPRLDAARPDDIHSLPLIHFEWGRRDASNPTWDLWFERAGMASEPSAQALHFSDEGHAIQAAIAGQGIALVSLTLVRAELESGQVTQMSGPVLDGHTYHLVTGNEPANGSPTALAWRWLRDQCRHDRDRDHR